MAESFKVGELEFKVRKMDAFKQFHIVRRIAPILADLLPALKEAARAKPGASEEEQLDAIAKVAGPVMNGLSKLSDEDANRVLLGLLSCSEMKQPTGNWANVSSDQMIMLQDLELPVLIQVAGKAFMYNLSGFFAALPKAS